MFECKINACGIFHHGRCGLLQDIGLSSLKMKRGDIVLCFRRSLRATRWKDRCDVYILINMHIPPVKGNFTIESGSAIKPCAAEDYIAYMGFVDKSDRMVNSFRTAQRALIKKLHQRCLSLTLVALVDISCHEGNDGRGEETSRNMRGRMVEGNIGVLYFAPCGAACSIYIRSIDTYVRYKHTYHT
jgi:hypothetical protein